MSGPLTGFTVFLTRAEGRDEELGSLLEARGATVVLAPAIRFERVDADPDPEGFGWLAVTSPTAADMLPDRLRDAALSGAILTAAVGPGTRQKLEQSGIRVAMTSRKNSAEGLAKTLLGAGEGPGTRALHPTSDRSREELKKHLDAAKVEVVEVVTYRTIAAESMPADVVEAFTEGATPTVVFASPSAIQGFLKALPPDAADRARASARAVAIGPTTGRALHDRKFRRVSVARQPTAKALAACVEAAVLEDAKKENRS